MKRRKTVSVTPAMGARTVAGAMRTAADGEAGGDAGVLGHRVLGGRVPAFLLEGVALLHLFNQFIGSVCG